MENINLIRSFWIFILMIFSSLFAYGKSTAFLSLSSTMILISPLFFIQEGFFIKFFFQFLPLSLFEPCDYFNKKYSIKAIRSPFQYYTFKEEIKPCLALSDFKKVIKIGECVLEISISEDLHNKGRWNYNSSVDGNINRGDCDWSQAINLTWNMELLQNSPKIICENSEGRLLHVVDKGQLMGRLLCGTLEKVESKRIVLIGLKFEDLVKFITSLVAIIGAIMSAIIYKFSGEGKKYGWAIPLGVAGVSFFLFILSFSYEPYKKWEKDQRTWKIMRSMNFIDKLNDTTYDGWCNYFSKVRRFDCEIVYTINQLQITEYFVESLRVGDDEIDNFCDGWLNFNGNQSKTKSFLKGNGFSITVNYRENVDDQTYYVLTRVNRDGSLLNLGPQENSTMSSIGLKRYLFLLANMGDVFAVTSFNSAEKCLHSGEFRGIISGFEGANPSTLGVCRNLKKRGFFVGYEITLEDREFSIYKTLSKALGKISRRLLLHNYLFFKNKVVIEAITSCISSRHIKRPNFMPNKMFKRYSSDVKTMLKNSGNLYPKGVCYYPLTKAAEESLDLKENLYIRRLTEKAPEIILDEENKKKLDIISKCLLNLDRKEENEEEKNNLEFLKGEQINVFGKEIRDIINSDEELVLDLRYNGENKQISIDKSLFYFNEDLESETKKILSKTNHLNSLFKKYCSEEKIRRAFVPKVKITQKEMDKIEEKMRIASMNFRNSQEIVRRIKEEIEGIDKSDEKKLKKRMSLLSKNKYEESKSEREYLICKRSYNDAKEREREDKAPKFDIEKLGEEIKSYIDEEFGVIIDLSYLNKIKDRNGEIDVRNLVVANSKMCIDTLEKKKLKKENVEANTIRIEKIKSICQSENKIRFFNSIRGKIINGSLQDSISKDNILRSLNIISDKKNDMKSMLIKRAFERSRVIIIGCSQLSHLEERIARVDLKKEINAERASIHDKDDNLEIEEDFFDSVGVKSFEKLNDIYNKIYNDPEKEEILFDLIYHGNFLKKFKKSLTNKENKLLNLIIYVMELMFYGRTVWKERFIGGLSWDLLKEMEEIPNLRVKLRAIMSSFKKGSSSKSARIKKESAKSFLEKEEKFQKTIKGLEIVNFREDELEKKESIPLYLNQENLDKKRKEQRKKDEKRKTAGMKGGKKKKKKEVENEWGMDYRDLY